MKKIILTLAIVATGLLSFSATNYETSMKEVLKSYRTDEAKNFSNYAAKMEKIAKKFSNEAEAYSWAAFFNTIVGFNESDAKKKDEVLKKAEKQIDKAIELDANNDEFYVIKAMVFQGQLLVDPQNRGMEYSAKAERMISKALELNPNNARAYYLRAQNVYNRPAQYGGGAKKALPIIKTAKKLIDKQNVTNELAPAWGKEEIESLLKACKK